MKLLPKNTKFKQQLQLTKKVNFANWFIALCLRKGIVINPDICAYGNNQIIAEVKQIAGQTIFRSRACSGCLLGLQTHSIHEIKKSKTRPINSACVFLTNSWFWANTLFLESVGLTSTKEISVGRKIFLPRFFAKDKSTLVKPLGKYLEDALRR